MATISNDQVEALARQLLWEQIDRSAWFREGLTDAERQSRIQREVEAWWHLKVEEAAHRLLDRTAYHEAAE